MSQKYIKEEEDMKEELGFPIMGLWNNRGFFPEVRGVVEKAEHLYLSEKVAVLQIWVGENMYSFSHPAGVPTILAGQEVILHCENDQDHGLKGIQVISEKRAVFRASKGWPWMSKKIE